MLRVSERLVLPLDLPIPSSRRTKLLSYEKNVHAQLDLGALAPGPTIESKARQKYPALGLSGQISQI
jgi:hypothetical protein